MGHAGAGAACGPRIGDRPATRCGSLPGTLCAYATGRVVPSLLFGGGFPFAALVGAALVIALVVVAASVVPVARAIRLNPSEVLRAS